VLDAVADEIAATTNLAAGGPGMSGVSLCGKSTTGRAHANGACNDGRDAQSSWDHDKTAKPTAKLAPQTQAMNGRRQFKHLGM
jgi:hypothetical protein